MTLLNLKLYFNSIKVQLERCPRTSSLVPYPNFNSIKVQLEQAIEDYYIDFSVFQFHKGTIRTWTLFHSLSLTLYFNSIKVQLEHVESPIVDVNHEFQFHKGTIRTNRIHGSNGGRYKFQFHKGTIRTVAVGNLKVKSLLFQFHKGTIRTVKLKRITQLLIISIP